MKSQVLIQALAKFFTEIKEELKNHYILILLKGVNNHEELCSSSH